ncbi:MAG: DUF2730 family protein [Hyphomicrobiales bacterium]|nr:DUF2730 family protein [Hyphomicrobiales bacterium]
MEYGNIAQWGALVLSMAAMLNTMFNNRSKRNEEALAKIKAEADLKAVEIFKKASQNAERLDRHELRLSSMEADFRHMPSKDAVHNLQLTMRDLQGQMAVVIERVGPIKAISERLQDVLLAEHTK